MLNNLFDGQAAMINHLDVSPILQDCDKDWYDNQHYTDTPKRVIKAWKEMLNGVYNPPPKFVLFENTRNDDTHHIINDIKVISVCAHHLLPVFCKLDVEIIFGEKLLGLSKYSRIAKWVFGRPGVQEDLIEEFADYIVNLIKPRALRITMIAQHTCMTIRGVEQRDATFKSVTTRGYFSTKDTIKELDTLLNETEAALKKKDKHHHCGCDSHDQEEA